MADEVLFAGGRLDSLEVVSGTPTEVTTSGTFDSSYADAATNLATSSQVVRACMRNSSFAATDVVTGETLYTHFESQKASTGITSGQWEWQLCDSSGNPWLRCYSTGGAFNVYYNSNTGASPTWVSLGALYTADTSRRIFDLKLTLGSPHSYEFSVAGTAVLTGTFTSANLTSLRYVYFTAPRSSAGSDHRVSQIMMTRGYSTIGGKVPYSRPGGAGSNSAWTGAYTNVNEAVNSDATVDFTTSAAVKQTYAMGDVTVPSGFALRSVFHWMRAKNDGTTPANIKSVIRSNGTDYSSGNLSGIGTSVGIAGRRLDTDPDTSAAWTQSGFNAIEAGYESAT